jgi:predicted nucleic acid-binding protein
MTVFVDTNVLVYAHDVDAKKKHESAVKLVRDLWERRAGILSTQVLQEFYATITRKIPRPVSKKDARELVHTYTAWRVVVVDAADILIASDFEERLKLSFWDSLILTSALKSNAETLVTEDLQDGFRHKGLIVTNPFK